MRTKPNPALVETSIPARHDEGGERAWDHARHKSERPSVAFVRVVIVSCRTPEQKGANQRHHYAACELELGRAAALSKGAADDGEAGEHQDKGKPNMRQGEDGAIGNPLSQSARLAEMIGHQHRLAVPRHHGMYGAEQHGSRHGSQDSARVSGGDIAETARHAAIEPTLDSNKVVHALVLVPRDGDFLKSRRYPFRQLYPIIICPEVHEKEARLLVEHVAVDGRYLDPVFAQGPDQRVHLVGRDHK